MYNIYFDDIIYELQSRGGISKYWSKLIDYFLNKDQVNLFNIRGKGASKNIFFNNNVTNKRDDISLPLMLRRYMPIFSKMNGQIFHSSYFRVPFQKSELKRVVTVHDFMYEIFDHGLRKNIHFWQKSRAIDDANAIICVSKNTKNDLLNYFPHLDTKQIYVVYNGVDDEFCVLNDKKCQFKINNTDVTKNKYLIYVGNRMGCKNFKFVISLYKESSFIKDNQFKLVCIGGGPFSSSEIKLFSESGIPHETAFINLQNVSNNFLNELYNGAYALLFPSIYEGFGIPALEAQKAGCPVVYANTSSLPEIMAYDDLLFEKNDISGAEHCLSKLKSDVLRNNLVDRGLQFSKKFSWQNTANDTFNVYLEVLNK